MLAKTAAPNFAASAMAMLRRAGGHANGWLSGQTLADEALHEALQEFGLEGWHP
jgi:hypothetical protein